MNDDTSAWPSSASRSAFAGCASTAAARCGPPDRLAGRLARLDRSRVHLEPELAQPVRHRVGTALAVRARVEQAFAEQRAAVVDPVAEHVQVLVLAVDRRDLGGRDHPDAVHGPGRERLVDTVDGVVI